MAYNATILIMIYFSLYNTTEHSVQYIIEMCSALVQLVTLYSTQAVCTYMCICLYILRVTGVHTTQA